MDDAINLEDLYSVKRLAEAFPELLSVSTLRWQVRNRETNGLSSAVVRIGKQLLISRSRYQEWLASNAGGAGTSKPNKRDE